MLGAPEGRSCDSGPDGPRCRLSSLCGPASRRALDWPGLWAKSAPHAPHQGGQPCARSQWRDRHPLHRAENPRRGPWPTPPSMAAGPSPPLPGRAQSLEQEEKPRKPAHPGNTLWGGSEPESSWRRCLGSEAQTSRRSEEKAEGDLCLQHLGDNDKASSREKPSRMSCRRDGLASGWQPAASSPLGGLGELSHRQDQGGDQPGQPGPGKGGSCTHHPPPQDTHTVGVPGGSRWEGRSVPLGPLALSPSAFPPQPADSAADSPRQNPDLSSGGQRL